MSIALRKAFIETVKKDRSLFELTTYPDNLNRIIYRIGDKLHGYGYDVFVAFEPIGFSVVPLASVMEGMPFIFYIDGKPTRTIHKDERVALICGEVKKPNIAFINTIPNVSIVLSLLHKNYSPTQRYTYLYDREELLDVLS